METTSLGNDVYLYDLIKILHYGEWIFTMLMTCVMHQRNKQQCNPPSAMRCKFSADVNLNIDTYWGILRNAVQLYG